MILKNHIATRFLKDDNLAAHMTEKLFKKDWDIWSKEIIKIPNPEIEHPVPFNIQDAFNLFSTSDQIAYYITDTVIDQFDLLKIETLDWTVFKNIPDGKFTFIMNGNHIIRIRKVSDILQFCYLYLTKDAEDGSMLRYFLWSYNTTTGKEFETGLDWRGNDKGKRFTYLLLCFMFLTKNDEVIIQPGQKYGTKKSGKIINTLKIPITMVNSRWNTTVIRNEGFEVRGHFRLQPCGKSRQNVELIFIEPFVKNGYTRIAKSINQPIATN